jgi:hypothetical protein
LKSELHHGSANNVARSEQINVLVDFIEFEELDAEWQIQTTHHGNTDDFPPNRYRFVIVPYTI